jgi:hypothetical protein
MILCVPIYPGVTDFNHLARAIRLKKSTSHHDLLVVCRPEDEPLADTFYEAVRPLFKRSRKIVLAPQPRGVVHVANDMFSTAVDFVTNIPWKRLEGVKHFMGLTGEARRAAMVRNAEVKEMGPEPTMLYLDPTYRPLVHGWMNQIELDYHKKDRPDIFGDIVDGFFTGPLVISRHFKAKSALVGFLPPNVHWREFLKHELANLGGETKLIGTGGYSVLKKPTSPGQRTRSMMRKKVKTRQIVP